MAEKSIDWWKGTLARLATMGVHTFAFTGGEPLLKDGIASLLDYAAGLQAPRFVTRDGQLVEEIGPVSLTLLTNGKLLDERILDLCARHGIAVGLSLPGLATFPYHTGGGDPGVVLRAFAETKARKLTTHAGITVTRRNLHELYETVAEALLAGAESVLLNRFMPGGRGLANVAELRLPPEGILEMLHTAEQVLAAANRRGHLGTEIPMCLVDGLSFSHLTVGFQCAAATEFFAIDPSGYLRVCNHSPVRIGSFDEVDQVARHPEWRRFSLNDYMPSDCTGCRSVGECHAGCREAARIVNGSPDALDPMVPALIPRPRRQSDPERSSC